MLKIGRASGFGDEARRRAAGDTSGGKKGWLTHAMRRTAVERLPEPDCGTLGGVQRGLGQPAVAGEKAQQLIAPDLRMADVGIGMESEVSAGVGIGAVVTQQARALSRR